MAQAMNYEAIAQTQTDALRDITLGRLGNYMGEGQFADVAFSSQRMYFERVQLKGIKVYSAPIEPPQNGRIRFDQVPPPGSPLWQETAVGESFGPTWSTHWFLVDVTLPDTWNNPDQEVHLIWNNSSEAMVWSSSGQPLQGLTGQDGRDGRLEYVLPAGTTQLYIEMACNGLFGAGTVTTITPPDPNLTFRLATADLGLFDREAWEMKWDMQIVFDMAKELPRESQLGPQVLRVANALANIVNPLDRSTWPKGRDLMAPFLSKNKLKGGAGINYKPRRILNKHGLPLTNPRHHVTAIGHCHIDTAWLWPYAETRRKVARSWSTQLELIDKYPGFKFVASQAQQYKWLQQDYPGLYDRVKQAIMKDDAGFSHVGGTWVEMDTNVPSGEALVRQFMLGQRFFQKEFGRRNRVFWLPDTFGYSGQLPQIVRSADIEYFLTQKLSWNNINKMPHHTFIWEGIDGSEVLTHFPPTDTYNADGNVNQLLHGVKNYKDKQSNSQSLMVYGVGDGGGGPQRQMIEQITRLENVDGLPSMDMQFPDMFFDRLKEESDGSLANWVGELYFELHRGTYTSQASTKQSNRECEQLMKNAEFLAFVAQNSTGFVYPNDSITTCWENICCNQFHDVLPGTSIGEVYDESTALYAVVTTNGNEIVDSALRVLVGATDDEKAAGQQGAAAAVFNTLSFERTELVDCTGYEAKSEFSQKTQDQQLCVFTAPSLGYSTEPLASAPKALKSGFVEFKIEKKKVADAFVKVFTLKNDFVTAEFLETGRLVRLFDERAGRNLVKEDQPANVFVIFDDVPLYWDAWDVEIYHLQTRQEVPPAKSATLVEEGPLRATIEFEYQITEKSSIRQRVSLTGLSSRIDFNCTVDWWENRKFLKVEFPVDIRNEYASYEIAYGALKRPTVANTTIDIAKFEVCNHRWMDLSEPNFGVALLNASKYGAACHRNVMRMSLLKSPKSPDADCDMGEHQINFALFSHRGDFQEGRVVQEAHAFNNPLIVRAFAREKSPLLDGTHTYYSPSDAVVVDQRGSRSYFSVLGADNVVLDAVKRAEDSEALVLRLYEAYGQHGTARVLIDLDRMPTQGALCNILEDDGGEPVAINNRIFTLDFTPFQMRTVKLTFAEK